MNNGFNLMSNTTINKILWWFGAFLSVIFLIFTIFQVKKESRDFEDFVNSEVEIDTSWLNDIQASICIEE